MKISILSLLVPLFFLAGCTDEVVVHVRLQKGEGKCYGQDLGVQYVESLLVRLKQVGATRMYQAPCIETPRVLSQLEDIERELQPVLWQDLESGSNWRLFVVGYSTGCVEENRKTVLCGMTSIPTMPPPDNQINISIDCIPHLSADPTLISKVKGCSIALDN